MPMSRLVRFSLENRSKVNLSLLRGLGSRRFQYRGYTGQPKSSTTRPDSQHLLPEKPSSSHSWSTYIVPTALLAIAGGAMLVHYNDERRAVLKGTEHKGNNIKGPTIGGPFSLIDMEHHLVTERNFRGNWVLLYFGYTSSPDVGPAEVQKMAEAVDILESKQNLKVMPVFVTIDPQRDCPSQLRAYLREFDQRIVGLTGPINAIRQMAQEYRVFFKKVEEEGSDYLVESSHNMYLLDPNMEILKCFGVEYDAEQLSEAILREVKKVI
ncbi:PREDICTED: protein SCO1 homolog 2, mitochondrial isoform X2 [Nelumbo nucifera]|uniref:Protein SCO1 homolog 2, mitochondrial isoform X2 n=1 Tax=Nelumbo nucifera TaxID=4432 RepID=A0A1U8A858_NELNU|nr:PREDICTED: protein SCO1 homolog 2, mitochondrial isoform X2 [Nelumbo nucifera]